MKALTDQCGNNVVLSRTPSRIVSLVPSQTELLFDLGLDAEVAGITRYCVHPPQWQQTKTIIGGTKNFDLKAIHHINPDLIIANKEENYKEGIELLQQQYPVWISDINTLEDAFLVIKTIGDITDRQHDAFRLIQNITINFANLKQAIPKKVLYMIWRKPWMAAGANTFIHTMLLKMGLKNAVEHLSRYPELTDDEISHAEPDLIFLSSEPFPFKEKHIHELKALVPDASVVLVDGEMFSWYGSRLKLAPVYFNSLKLDWI